MVTYLIRHGEVENPDHVVYADLPGFSLSVKGRQQATATGNRLSTTPPTLIVASPLERAVETAHLIAEATGASVETDERLTEWLLSQRWAGTGWEALAHVFPGELETYLQRPTDLPFSPESLHDLARRVASCVEDWAAATDGPIAFVSHQDPIHSGYRVLTRQGFDDYHTNKPAHCGVMSLQRDHSGWASAGYWAPDQ